MNKKVAFLSFTLVVCLVLAFLAHSFRFGIHRRIFQSYGNKTQKTSQVRSHIIKHIVKILRDRLNGRNQRNKSAKVNATSSSTKDGNDATRSNISQVEFEITQEVLRTLRGEFKEKQLRERAAKVNITARRKVLLMYTPFFGDHNWLVKSLQDFETTYGGKCPFYQCEVTMDTKRFAQSDAVIFHARDMTSMQELRNLQKTRPSHQRWIYFIMESPMYTPNPSPYNNMFNWTMSYRADSDLRFPYGNYFPRVAPWKEEEEESLKKIVASKNKLVFWAASHCGVLRDQYVRKLRKHVNVDVFGACGAALGGASGSCSRFSKECTEKLRNYKFALAFENHMCEDYVTEKYWGKLSLDVVPVVMGGSTYDSKIAVPGSYINAADFPTVQALANHLLYLDKNNTAYMELFEWKKKYVARGSLFYFPCALCAKLNLDHKPKVYERLDETWSKTKHCGTMDKIFHDIINRS